ncbi:MAG: hypothetical protein J5714_00330 [Alphaproteobacteria bacterium]|nr:hypothetical protein [Alphaproteobacteria bacterium]
MPTSPKLNENDTQRTYDKDLARFAKRIAAAYSEDKIRLVASRSARRAVLLHDIDAINDIIRDIPNMPSGLRTDFCDAFIGEKMEGLDLATPAILGYAYRAISARAKEGEKGQQERLDKLAARIDDLSADFANSGGMVVRQHEWPLINITNIANENEDFSIMLDARMADVDGEKKAEMVANKQQADTRAQDYDEAWNLNKVKPEDVDKLSERWDEIYRVLYRTDVRDTVLEKFAKCKMLDSKGNVIPQFRGGRDDPEEHEEYKPGFRILDDSRFASIVELVDHDIAKRYVADVNAKIDKDAIESELNETLLIKLYEIYAADQVTNGAFENPEQFADPEMRDKFMQMLEPDGDGIEISDRGYNVAIETQTDATVGWGARLRNKIGGTGKNLERFWKKVNRPLNDIDDMADVRMSRAAVARRKKRRNLAGRIIVGFGSSFIASALITVIVTAAAARLGLSLASGLAWVGGGATLAIMGFQVARWIINQKKNNLPVTWEEFKKNGQLLRSLGTSGLAIIAMVLGVKGWATAAMAVGIGALALGAYNNARGVFQSALDSKMSQRQKIAWTIASVASVILGAFGGRAFAHFGINKINTEWNPDNTLFQNKHLERGEPVKVSDEVTDTKTTTHYPDDAVPRAEKAVTDWYQEKYPKDWEQHLAQDIRAVEQYNADTGSDMNPYRALRAIRLTDPERFAYTDAWRGANNVTADQVNTLANAIGPDGTYNLEGMKEASNFDLHHLGVKGEIGDNIPGHRMRSGDLYRSIEKLPTQTTEKIVVKPAVYEDTWTPKNTPVHGDGAAMFGIYPPRERKTQLRDRLGSFVDRVRHGLRPDKSPKDDMSVVKQEEPIVPPIVEDEQRDEYLPATESTVQQDEFIPVKDELENQDIFTAPVKEETDVLPPFDLSEENDEPDERLGEHVRPAMGSRPLGNLFPKPVFEDNEGHLRRLRESHEVKPSDNVETPIALLTEGQTKFKPFTEPFFALTPEQAERWEDLHRQMSSIRAKRKSPSVRADNFLKYRKQEEKIEKEIDRLYNQLGRPSTLELNQALAEVHRREKLQQLIAELNRHMQRKPTGDAKDWQIMKWLDERNKILQKIEDYGGVDSLDDTNLRFAAPTNVERRQKMQDEKLKDASVVNRGLKIRTGDSVNVDLLPDTGIGVPITLFCMDADLQTPLMRNGNQIAVVADIDGIRVPFVLAGNDSKANKTPGKWYPMLGLDSTIGQPLFRDWGVMSSETVKELFEKIGKELDTRFGDVRKDINKIQEFNRETFFHIMDSEGNTYKKYFVWGPMGGGQLLSVNDMRKYLDGLEEIYHQDNLRPGERFLRGISQVVTGARERGLLPNRRLFKRWRE